MKTVCAILLLVAAAQAIDWANVRPMIKTRPSVLPVAPVNGRIIGGTLATMGQFPHQVGVFMDSSYFCGGSLISDMTVLTAAHCVDGFRTWDIHAGALNIRDESEPGRVIVRSTNGVRHENYGPFFIINDIAVVHLPESVTGPNIGAVRLPARSLVGNALVGTVGRVSGWGKISDAAPGITDVMQYVDLTIITNEECAAYYGTMSVRDTVVCIGTNGGVVSTCNGDSGGPLTMTEADGEITEIGIVSFGSSAGCQSGAPAAFTRVTEYLDWIETNGNVNIRP